LSAILECLLHPGFSAADDGCGNTLNCGGCQTGYTCVLNVCTESPGNTPVLSLVSQDGPPNLPTFGCRPPNLPTFELEPSSRQAFPSTRTSNTWARPQALRLAYGPSQPAARNARPAPVAPMRLGLTRTDARARSVGLSPLRRRSRPGVPNDPPGAHRELDVSLPTAPRLVRHAIGQGELEPARRIAAGLPPTLAWD
jgi:hypothetical protein